MALLTNPLVHRPGAGSASPSEAQEEAGVGTTGHIPTVEAFVLVGAAGLLWWFTKAGFKFVGTVSAGRS